MAHHPPMEKSMSSFDSKEMQFFWCSLSLKVFPNCYTQVDGHVEAPILVRTSRSSQNAQGGRTRPFRMLARAIWKDGTPIEMILPDVSEPFVVRFLSSAASFYLSHLFHDSSPNHNESKLCALRTMSSAIVKSVGISA